MKKLKPPKSQIQQILYALISRMSIDRKSMMLEYNVMNLTAQISLLRNKKISIKTTSVILTNVFNNEIKYTRYLILDKKNATLIYEKMQLSQSQLKNYEKG